MGIFYIGIYSLFVISLALALDAFGVALSLGLNPLVKRKNKISFCISFGFFQFFLALMGSYMGYLFNTYILAIPKIIGGIIIAIVGIMMLKEGMKRSSSRIIVSRKMYFILGISVSIDAAVVGFTVLNNINKGHVLLEATMFIGLITLIMCIIAFTIAKYLRKIDMFSKYADYVGGIILVLFGIKMIFL